MPHNPYPLETGIEGVAGVRGSFVRILAEAVSFAVNFSSCIMVSYITLGTYKNTACNFILL